MQWPWLPQLRAPPIATTTTTTATAATTTAKSFRFAGRLLRMEPGTVPYRSCPGIDRFFQFFSLFGLVLIGHVAHGRVGLGYNRVVHPTVSFLSALPTTGHSGADRSHKVRRSYQLRYGIGRPARLTAAYHLSTETARNEP